MTKYCVPIRTVEDLDAALAAGASGEFTAYPDPYDLPQYDPRAPFPYEGGFSGWVPSELIHWRGSLQPGGLCAAKFESGHMRLRAFYPDGEVAP